MYETLTTGQIWGSKKEHSMVLPELDAEVHFWLFLVLETVLQIASYGWKAVGVAEERRILPISGGMWLPHRVFIAFSWYLIL